MGEIAKHFEAKGGEPAFQRDMQFAPGYRDWRIEFARRFGDQPNIEPGGDYDYRTAWANGIKPEVYSADGTYHWGSTTPAGRMLKAPEHPTDWMQNFVDRFGDDPNDASPATINQAIADRTVPFVGVWTK